MEPLAGKSILLGLSGGIACYKSAQLCRLLRQAGAQVRVMMSEAATHFITPLTLQTLSGQPVQQAAFSPADAMPHINLTRSCDLLLFAPASADLVARLAQGRADDLLALTALARPGKLPLLLAPAMNQAMWHNPACQRNLAQLRQDGVEVLPVGMGDQACGEHGEGRMLEPEQILQAVRRALTPARLAGLRVLITAGPTYEAIDPVRGLSNRSSGKMGFALAQAAYESGAQVQVVAGPVALPTPWGVERNDCESALEMAQLVHNALPQSDLLICCAAVADWRPAQCQKEKIKKEGGVPELALLPNPDILALALASEAARSKRLFCVGFAAESSHLLAHARAKRQRKGVPLLLANLAPETFGEDHNSVYLLDEEGETAWPPDSKINLARRLMAELPQRIASWQKKNHS